MFVKVPRGEKGQIRKASVITERAKPTADQKVGSPLSRVTVDDLPTDLPDGCSGEPMLKLMLEHGRLVKCEAPSKDEKATRAKREAAKAEAKGRGAGKGG